MFSFATGDGTLTQEKAHERDDDPRSPPLLPRSE
jgi:hypothetical protein